jgi:hypothetical protein
LKRPLVGAAPALPCVLAVLRLGKELGIMLGSPLVWGVGFTVKVETLGTELGIPVG